LKKRDKREGHPQGGREGRRYELLAASAEGKRGEKQPSLT